MSQENRITRDRRKRPTRAISKYTFVGRRKRSRREEEANNYYVDKFERKYLILIGLVLILSVFDAIFSLKIFNMEGNEFNPIMSFLINRNIILALVTKFIITVLALLFLLIHKNFKLLKYIKVDLILYFVFFVHFALFLYQCYILFSIGAK